MKLFDWIKNIFKKKRKSEKCRYYDDGECRYFFERCFDFENCKPYVEE